MTEQLIQKLKLQQQKNKIIAVVGPTASGKSSFAIKLAKELDGEIISADSRLVYKGLDIGTAKPTEIERCEIPHYMIDIVEPECNFTVANYVDEAKKLIFDIQKRKKQVIIAGGTGLYFRMLLEDFDMPRVEPNYELRKELENLPSKDLHQILSKLDPKSAEKIHYNNKVKIIRAIEVTKALNIPHSKAATKKAPEYDVDWIGLNYTNRENLYDKINNRVIEMINSGLVEETKQLLEKHGRISNLINTIGYQEIINYLDGNYSIEQAIEDIQKNSRHYAKRQLTWFNKNKLINWIYLL